MKKFIAGAFAALIATAPQAQAQSPSTWPSRPITMIVPYLAGGATDALARVLGAKLQEQLKISVIIENKGGAGGNIGTNAVAKAAPDGYTILFNINGHAISPAIYKSLSYDADKDFLRITQLVSTASVLVIDPKLPAKNLPEFIALAKANPNKFNYGSTGVGNSLHLTMEMLKSQTGTDIEMVPFRGDAPLFTALFGSELQVAVVPLITARPHIDSGAVLAIGVTTAQRVAALPDVPTIAEQGLPGFELAGWMGLFAPAGTPRAIVDRLWRESKIAIEAPDLAPRLANLALTPVASSPEEFDKVYMTDREKFQRIIRDAKIPLQD